VDNLICTECGTTYYSAAAETMVARGERCDCGALLRIHDTGQVPVGGPPVRIEHSAQAPRPRGRFARD
jgi:hypothetical protein